MIQNAPGHRAGADRCSAQECLFLYVLPAPGAEWVAAVILGRVSNDSFGSFETRPKMTKMTHGVSAVPQPTSLKPMPQTVLM